MTYLQIAIALVAFVAIAPLALPRTVNVERDASISGDHSAEILALAASNEGYQRFNPYHNTDPDLKIEPFGPPSGVGSGFRFEASISTLIWAQWASQSSGSWRARSPGARRSIGRWRPILATIPLPA